MILSKECHERGCAAYDDRVDEGVVLTNEGEHMKAFPNKQLYGDAEGMDLRDYFAAKAMPLAMQWLKRIYQEELGDKWSWDAEDAEEIADTAYMMADAMMKARENQ